MSKLKPNLKHHAKPLNPCIISITIAHELQILQNGAPVQFGLDGRRIRRFSSQFSSIAYHELDYSPYLHITAETEK